MENSQKERLFPEGFLYYPEGYLWYVLPVEKFSCLPKNVSICEEEFNLKSEFHVTIANIRAIAREFGELMKRSSVEKRLYSDFLLSMSKMNQ